eukprot:GILJ01004639.1.p1 GENE.GILJ01004639.1~~GILJ01004639.1.p1  ORF type:complete len:535 (+),score=77.58 GILJ01004639.1:53-1657(+)
MMMLLRSQRSARIFSSAVKGRLLSTLTFNRYPFLQEIALKETNDGCFGSISTGSGGLLTSLNPATNQPIAYVKKATAEDYDQCVRDMESAKHQWMTTPIPVRGEVVRQIGDALRKYRTPLGKLIALEVGKIEAEGIGEVQEFIDICDLAVGLSRQIGGKVLPSERASHFMMEQWHPLGAVGVISAFNFPAAVLGWNAALALVCGNAVIWKGSETTPLTTVAVTKIVADVLKHNGLPPSLFCAVIGGRDLGQKMVDDPRIPLISFTGSTAVGKAVGTAVQSRFGKSILELGGNNATIVMQDANLDLALRACLFAAVGTTGQRCTSLRRLFLHESIHDAFLHQLVNAYKQIKIGDPLEAGTLCGPLHTKSAVTAYAQGIEEALKQGGSLVAGGRVLSDREGNFVEPTLISIHHDAPIVKKEIFAPILYVMKVHSIEQAIHHNNEVPQGLSSSLFTNDLTNLFKWTGPAGSDCGIVNVNMGPSGAEIGGAFGGEKETGGGRESGSDAWKAYMRRVTTAVNYSSNMPLAQGITFNVAP